MRRSNRRSGFTLLEVLLASSLAVILMAALYVALDVQLRLANDGREAVEQATVVRSIVHRINTDLTNGLGPMSPQPKSGTSNTAQSGTTGMTGAGMTGMTTGMTTGGTVVEEEDMTMVTAIPPRAGVIGVPYANDDSGRLTIFVGRVAGVGRNLDESGEGANPSDIRRITYWQTPHGLARQEIPWFTSESVRNTTEPLIEEGKEERDYVIAEEVVRIQFEFWDAAGQTWATEWDGQEPGPDGVTPKGPPSAVRVRFWMLVPDTNPDAETNAKVEKEFRHTIAILGASGPATSDADTAASNQATQMMMP